jgi:simple sugar transport system ATP-binding protein
MAVPAVSMQGITKRFPGVVANDRVDFEVAAGEVHALLGENGAGKSTLSHILTGLYRPDEGRIVLNGEQVDFASPREAIDAGVGMVHQHFRLVPRFTVAENLVLGDRRGAGRNFRIHPGAVESQVRELGSATASPSIRAHLAAVGRRQQRVEILKALYQEARIPHPRRPTAVLTRAGRRAIRDGPTDGGGGRTVIFISPSCTR